MLKKLIPLAALIDNFASLVLAGWSVYALYQGQELQAVYLILGAIFMGRGQVVRMTAREIRAEMEKAGVE